MHLSTKYRILFWDILISFLDTVSDFAQGVVLYSTPEKQLYGVFTLAINWIPGIPAAIHLVSMYRTEFPWYCTLLYAALLIGKYNSMDTNYWEHFRAVWAIFKVF